MLLESPQVSFIHRISTTLRFSITRGLWDLLVFAVRLPPLKVFSFYLPLLASFASQTTQLTPFIFVILVVVRTRSSVSVASKFPSTLAISWWLLLAFFYGVLQLYVSPRLIFIIIILALLKVSRLLIFLILHVFFDWLMR